MLSFPYFVLTMVLITKFGIAQKLQKGDTCILEESGDSGLCVSLKNCKSAMMELRFGKRPQVCLYEGSVSIVCCDTSQDGFNSPATSGAIPSLFLRRISRAAGLDYPTCPALRPEAVKVQKTGQKAWDKCIDLAESVYRCQLQGFTLRSPWHRVHECGHTAAPLVVGGIETAESEFPHMAAVGNGDPKFPEDFTWNCGGSLISKLWVLTAAHCLNNRTDRHAKLVRLGGGNLRDPPKEGNLYTVDLLVKHPKYRRISKYNDIGLLKLNREVQFSKNVRPICLHTGEPINNELAMVSGWGANETHGDMTANLLKATVQKFNFEECSETYEAESPKLVQGILNATQTCYGHRNESRDTCQGDSGGPLQIYNSERVDCTYLLIGITSFGENICGGPGIPAVYTRVSAFIPWIEENVWPDN